MAKDYGVSAHADASVSVAWASGATGATGVITVTSSEHQIYVQQILMSVIVDAAQSLTFRDQSGSPIICGVSPASPGLGLKIVSDFGPLGFPLSVGKSLDITGAAGLAAVIYIQAYQKYTTPLSN